MENVQSLISRLLATPAAAFLQSSSPHILCISGGADSIALLEIYKELSRMGKLASEPVVFHLDHKLRKESTEDSNFVIKCARESGFACYLETRSVANFARRLGKGLEESGRLLRYRILARMMKDHPNGVAVTAHHADDFLESVLIHLVRGGGPSSISTLPLIGRVHGVNVFRPLVIFRKTDLDLGLEFVQDHSNSDESFLRNRIRSRVTPQLHLEGIDPVRLWKNFHNDDPEMPGTLAADYIALPRELFIGINRGELKNLLDLTFKRMELPPAGSTVIAEIQKMVQNETFRILYKTAQFQIWSDRRGPIYLFKTQSSLFVAPVIQKSSDQIIVRYANTIRAIPVTSSETISTFEPGMFVKLRSAEGEISKKLKKVFQEKGIPGPVRKNIPLLIRDGRVTRAYISFFQGDDLIFL